MAAMIIKRIVLRLVDFSMAALFIWALSNFAMKALAAFLLS